MLFGMPWWASLLVLFTLLVMAMELSEITGDEDDEVTTLFDYTAFYGRMSLYVLLVLMMTLYFQRTSESFFFLILCGIVLLLSVYILLADFYDRIKEKFSKKETQPNPETGAFEKVIDIFAATLMYGFYVCAFYLAYRVLAQSISWLM